MDSLFLLMITPVQILAKLNRLTAELDEAQAWVNLARAHHPGNGLLQLELDRKQTEIDERRKLVDRMMFDIPRRN